MIGEDSVPAEGAPEGPVVGVSTVRCTVGPSEDGAGAGRAEASAVTPVAVLFTFVLCTVGLFAVTRALDGTSGAPVVAAGAVCGAAATSTARCTGAPDVDAGASEADRSAGLVPPRAGAGDAAVDPGTGEAGVFEARGESVAAARGGSTNAGGASGAVLASPGRARRIEGVAPGAGRAGAPATSVGSRSRRPSEPSTTGRAVAAPEAFSGVPAGSSAVAGADADTPSGAPRIGRADAAASLGGVAAAGAPALPLPLAPASTRRCRLDAPLADAGAGEADAAAEGFPAELPRACAADAAGPADAGASVVPGADVAGVPGDDARDDGDDGDEDEWRPAGTSDGGALASGGAVTPDGVVLLVG
ncbi:MAG: hypothetical protein AMXMBFR23_10800 [Chloroflexota bacterium]